jgi:hypothetical protein
MDAKVNSKELVNWRMRNLRLLGEPFEIPEQVVGWLGAVQSQDFGPAKWSIGQRTRRGRQTSIDEAFTNGSILRTHVLRPTWHFCLAEDIRWMLELTAPRVHSRNSTYYTRFGLDKSLIRKSKTLISRSLNGGERLTRKEIGDVLNRSGIDAYGGTLGFILMQAELDGVVCSGMLKGKQQTYALLEERAATARMLSEDEALAELTRRYFTSHGPATIRDFSWWSSLKVSDIKRGLEMAGAALENRTIDGHSFWFAPPAIRRNAASKPTIHLLQGYDEYIVGYRETKYLLDLRQRGRSLPTDRPIFTGAVIVDGQVEGHWRSKIDKSLVAVDVALYEPFDDLRAEALHRAIAEYGKFLESEVTVEISLI